MANAFGNLTEIVSDHANETLAGVINATMGNVIEAVVGFVAIAQGNGRIVQVKKYASIFFM